MQATSSFEVDLQACDKLLVKSVSDAARSEREREILDSERLTGK